ncbi:MAG: aminotransferase class V-fold PLP-dependent enzyme [Gemmatimonadetes bacterium]|nr:aminotransferase class V-fold PLP-dependent enzyme [Gemmatimonadota bacterium]
MSRAAPPLDFRDIVYLDFAATAAIRPEPVVDAVATYLGVLGATPGRGAHRLAIAAARVALDCRQGLARLLDIPGDPGRIAFMFNATHAINTAMAGVLQPGDSVVVTAFDHNAALRCAHKLARERGIAVRLVPGDTSGALDEAALERALDGARLLSINGASNVLGTTLPVDRLCALAREAGALSLVDTAQVAGELPFSGRLCGADLVAVTGHKALLGPQGVGALWVREGVEVVPLLVGGTGGDSMLREMPDTMPDRLEAGTTNAPGMAGLAAGIRWIEARGLAAIRAHSRALKVRLWQGLDAIPDVRVHSPLAPDAAPIVTITAADIDPATLAHRLDRDFGVLVRPGLHCAPEVHRLLGTTATGALRFSIGWSTVERDVDRAIEAVGAVVHGRPAGTIHVPH